VAEALLHAVGLLDDEGPVVERLLDLGVEERGARAQHEPVLLEDGDELVERRALLAPLGRHGVHDAAHPLAVGAQLLRKRLPRLEGARLLPAHHAVHDAEHLAVRDRLRAPRVERLDLRLHQNAPPLGLQLGQARGGHLHPVQPAAEAVAHRAVRRVEAAQRIAHRKRLLGPRLPRAWGEGG
jgi:hypothetical protein